MGKNIERFVDNGDNTITDTRTGLMWVKDHNALGKQSAGYLTWPKAIDACKDLDHAGRKDWRLPTREELLSIVDPSKYDPAIDPIFTNTHSDWYWTSTGVAWGSGSAWFVYFLNGNVYSYGKDYESYVRPVRSSQ
jgi:hypothetical protein